MITASSPCLLGPRHVHRLWYRELTTHRARVLRRETLHERPAHEDRHDDEDVVHVLYDKPLAVLGAIVALITTLFSVATLTNGAGLAGLCITSAMAFTLSGEYLCSQPCCSAEG